MTIAVWPQVFEDHADDFYSVSPYASIN